jgi:hypothetical protein
MASLLDDLRREQLAATLALTPAERLRLGEQLREESIRLLMSSQRLDRATALRTASATRRIGRRRCECLDEDPR